MTSTPAAIMWSALGGDAGLLDGLRIDGDGCLPSAFAVTELAASAIGVTGLASGELVAALQGGSAAEVRVDRAVASAWYGAALHPVGWSIPSPWHPLSTDYRARDGWIRLHTNAPHHRGAALAVLGVGAGSAAVDAEPAAVADAVAGWHAHELEAAVVAAGGAAAAMRSIDAWRAHPQGWAVAAEPLVRWTDAASAGRSDRWRPAPGRPLHGLRVLDLTRVIAGPVATRVLAGLGATVLRIDPPDWDEPAVVPDMTLGKRTARLDARTAEGARRLRALLADADVLVHGYRPGALERLGLGEAVRAELRPGLIEASLDAYGFDGPWATRRGFDSLVQMSSGIAHRGGEAAGVDGPRPLPVQALDHTAGYLLAAAVLRGLTDSLDSGRGSSASTSLARIAELLIGLGDAASAGPLRDVEHDRPLDTAWGPARMLPPPFRADGVLWGFDRGPSPLGSDAPRFD